MSKFSEKEITMKEVNEIKQYEKRNCEMIPFAQSDPVYVCVCDCGE